MILLVPYAEGFLFPETRDSIYDAQEIVARSPVGYVNVQFLRCDGEEGYYLVLRKMWELAIKRQQDLVVVEQDHVINAEVLTGFFDCKGTWCLHGYSIGTGNICEAGLGCVRWRYPMMAYNPDLIEVAASTVRDGVPAKHWVRMDTRIYEELSHRGYATCVHQPPIEHLHDYADGSGPGRKNPLLKAIPDLND